MDGRPRIIDIELDDQTILSRSDEVDRERQVAVTDLLAATHFRAGAGLSGGLCRPFRVALSVAEGRLAIDVKAHDGQLLERQILSLARFRRIIEDYFAICDSYFRAVRQASATQIETIDMARRGLHNRAAEILRECLEGKIAVDLDTARRLFTLIFVLHIRN